MTANYAADLALFINGSWRTGEGRECLSRSQPGNRQGDRRSSHRDRGRSARGACSFRGGFAQWKTQDVEVRGAILHKVADLIRERADSIAVLLTMEQGKPLDQARGEIIGAASMFDFYAEEAKRAYGRVLVRPTGQRAMVLKQPVGPTAIFTPWNFPVYLLAKKLAPALAAGCSVIAKPAEETPAARLR